MIGGAQGDMVVDVALVFLWAVLAIWIMTLVLSVILLLMWGLSSS